MKVTLCGRGLPLRELRVEQHSDKTFVGWIKHGFTFLGYWITEKGVTRLVHRCCACNMGCISRT